MTEQTENISRVASEIGSHIIAFIDRHMNQDFHCEALRQYVYSKVDGYVAPGSPDRILRDLRQKGKVNYSVINRRQSLYRALPVKGQLRLFQ